MPCIAKNNNNKNNNSELVPLHLLFTVIKCTVDTLKHITKHKLENVSTGMIRVHHLHKVAGKLTLTQGEHKF